jgi:hypothetical protein
VFEEDEESEQGCGQECGDDVQGCSESQEVVGFVEHALCFATASKALPTRRLQRIWRERFMAQQLDGEDERCQFLQGGVRCEGEQVACRKVGVCYRGRRRFWRKMQSRFVSRWESRASAESASEEVLGEDEYLEYSEPEYLYCDVVYEYQQYQAVKEVASVDELMNNALVAGLCTSAGQGFVTAWYC